MRRQTLQFAVLANMAGVIGCQSTDNPAAPQAAVPGSCRGIPVPGRGSIRGYVYDRDGQPRHVSYEVQSGDAILEGDILLGPADQIALSPEQLRTAPQHAPGGPSFGVVRDGAFYRWPGGVVPYEIAATLPSPSRVTGAIAKIEATTPSIHLVPRSGQADYIRFVPSTGCS